MSEYHIETSHKSKKTTLIVCACGGYLGAHYYYVGRYGKGLLYTLTLGLFLIGWIADLIKISGGTFKDGAGVAIRK